MMIGLIRNKNGGINAFIEVEGYGLCETTLSGIELEKAEAGKFGEIAPLPEFEVRRKLINDQQLIIDENLAYLVSTDYYQGRNEEHIALGLEPVSDINEVLLRRQDSRQVIHAARLEVKLLNGEAE